MITFIFVVMVSMVVSMDTTYPHLSIRLSKHTTKHHHLHHLQSEVEMDNYMNMQYSGRVTIGEQDLEILFDTGSQVMWAFSKDCSTCNGANLQYQRVNFDCQESANCLETKHSYKITYGSGFINGNRATDRITIGNATLDEYPFLIVKQASGLQQLNADGICGLAPTSVDGFPCLLDMLHDKQYIHKRIFSIFLNTLPQEINNHSLLILGGYDPAYALSEPIYFPLIEQDRWVLKLDHILLDQYPLNMTSTKVLIDSGTSLIILPTHDFGHLLNSLREQYQQFCQYSRLQILCSCPEANYNEFPTINFKLSDDAILSLQPKDYITNEVSTCVLAFGKSSLDYVILGDTLFQKYITIFDKDQHRIGFTEAVQFEKQGKLIQINDSLYIFKVLLTCLCTAIFTIWLIRKISNLGGASHEIILQ